MTDRAHRMLYRDIPKTSPCKPGCQRCCGPVPWSPAEFAAVQDAAPATGAWVEIVGQRVFRDQITGMCPFLTASGCGVYDRRPFMCRVFGASSDALLVCPEGAKAKRPLTVRQTGVLANAYRRLETVPAADG